MKNTFLAAAVLIVSVTAEASCPSFKTSYESCQSRSRISAFQVSEVSVRQKIPFYGLQLTTPDGRKELDFMADGEAEEITIQDQAGSELSYTQTAYCGDQKVTLDIRSEENFGLESYVFTPQADALNLKIYLNQVLINEVNCR